MPIVGNVQGAPLKSRDTFCRRSHVTTFVAWLRCSLDWLKECSDGGLFLSTSWLVFRTTRKSM